VTDVRNCPRRLVVALVLALLGAVHLGCANAWEKALEEDSSAGYHRFLRQYPESEHAKEARERIDFHALRRDPTLENFEAFQEDYPNSALLAALRPQLERARFDRARAIGTVEAYEEFATRFPDGELTERALGNAHYLREVQDARFAEELRAFAERYPQSDFAAEAERSAAALELRDRARIRSVGLVVELAADAPESGRVLDAFVDRATGIYKHAGVALEPLHSLQSSDAARHGAILTISHREQEVDSKLSDGILARPGVDVSTRVELRAGDRVVWERSFELHVESREHVEGSSILFGSQGPRFWDAFFVPIASWPSRAAVREPVSLGAELVAVDVAGNRAVALLANGGFQVLQLADPTAPHVIGEYRREGAGARLERFDGVRIIGEHVVVFGQDGLEIVRVDGDAIRRVSAYSRGQVGSIFALERMGPDLLLGSSKGLLRLSPSGGEAARLMRSAIPALARSGELLLVADEDMLFLSTSALLEQRRVLSQERLGRDFAVDRIRVFGSTAFVLGKGGLIVLDVSQPRRVRTIARILPERLGRVDDVERIGSRIFLVGERGVQLLGPRLDRVVEIVDAVPARRAAGMGRHLVTVGEEVLQVVDALPFAPHTTAPAKAGASGRSAATGGGRQP